MPQTKVKRAKASYPDPQERGRVQVEWCRSEWNGVELGRLAENIFDEVALRRRSGQLKEILTKQATLEDESESL